MYKLLLNTPFGFVIELDGNSAYERENEYRVIVDGSVRFCGRKNVFSVFGLLPGTKYTVEIEGLRRPLRFEHETEKAGFVADVKDYTAGDDTLAINTAVYTAPAGSVVRIPKGGYTIGSLFLKSGVDIYLEKGAVLRQRTERGKLAVVKGYQKNYEHTDGAANASWEGNPLDCFVSLVYGRDAEGVRIYGEGVLDGSGAEGGFWNSPKTKDTAWRPRNIFLAYCKNITVAGITSRNSAAWNVHPFYSDGLKFYDMQLECDPNSPNTDGINPESCKGVEIIGCGFDVGDDCVAIKSGKIFMGRRHFKPSEDIEIRNCLMEKGHGGVVIGSEISCGARNVDVRQCLFRGTDRGFRVKSRRGRGAASVVDGIRFSDVVMEGVGTCFSVNMFYNCDPDGRSEYVRAKTPLPVTDETPRVKNIVIERVKATGISGCGIFVYGLPESPVKGVKISDSEFEFLENRPVSCPDMFDDEVLIKDLGVFLQNVEGETMTGNKFCGSYVSVLGDYILNTEERYV